MKALDRVLQRWRFEKTRRYLRPGDRVLDIGSADGALFRTFPWLDGGVGVDPDVRPESFPPHAKAVRGTFPDALGPEGDFDAITLLAVLEHIPTNVQPGFARAALERLRRGGFLLVTVPSPQVDQILDVLMKLRVLDGMEVGQHYGFEPAQTVPLFEDAGFKCVQRNGFQLGLNHFFAFRKP
jgi:hypothetical protein